MAMDYLKRALRPLRDAAGNIVHRLTIPLRRRKYVGKKDLRAISRRPFGGFLGLTDESAVGARRLEIGGGRYPRDGFIHLDIGPEARHLEYRCPAWNLPFPDEWASEISAIHLLEHIPPRMLDTTLCEWHRVLAPSGQVHISVPNAPALMDKFNNGSLHEKWLCTAALLGQYAGPDIRVPEGIRHSADHQIIFDFQLLESALAAAGFSRIADVTESRPDRHTAGWKNLVDHLSLVVVARKASE